MVRVRECGTGEGMWYGRGNVVPVRECGTGEGMWYG